MRGTTIIVRRTIVLLSAALPVLFLFVQLQQRLLRHRAELLFADIKALQLHPGTFADLQSMQRRWGAFGHYDGTCTAQHCNYTIFLTDLTYGAIFKHHLNPPVWVYRTYSALGGRVTGIFGQINVHNDHMWLEGFDIVVWVLPGQRMEGNWSYGYGLSAGLRSGSRLFARDDIKPADLNRGYVVHKMGICTGCILVSIHTTPQTDPNDLDRLSRVNFDCITRRKPCLELQDIVPNVQMELDRESKEKQPDPYKPDCAPPISTFAREAENAVLVEILGKKNLSEPGLPPGVKAHVRIVARLKNAADKMIGGDGELVYTGEDFYPASTDRQREQNLKIGDRAIVFYSDPRPLDDSKIIAPDYCSIIPVTDDSLKQVRKGIALDTSAGEPPGHW